MNKFRFKNYLILTLVSFLSIIGIVRAADSLEYTLNFPYGAVQNISKGDYEGLNCRGEGLKAFTLQEDSQKYIITYKNATNDKTPEKLICEWDKKINAQEDDPEKENNSSVYHLVPDVDNKDVMHLTIGYGDYNGENYTVDVFKELKGASITRVISSSKHPEGGEYINVSCSSGTTCTVSPTPRATENPGEEKLAYLTVTFEDNNGVTKNTMIAFHINIFDGARAYYGDVGTCSFDSNDWENRTWSDNAGKSYRFYQSENSSAVLPNCTPKSTTPYPVEFKGWTKGNNSSSILNAIGECKNTVSPGTKVTARENYSACYEAKKMVQLALSEGNISGLGNPWQPGNGMGLIGYYAVANSENDTVTLPEVTFVGFSTGTEFVAWENQTTRERKQPGASIPVDGSVWVGIIEKTTQSWTDRNKTIYVGDEATLSSTQGATTGCSSSNGAVSASYSNGVCKITGNSSTNEAYVDVYLTVSGSEQPIIYKVRVKDRLPEVDAREDFTIDVTPGVDYSEVSRGEGTGNAGTEEPSSDEISISSSVCTSFDVSASGQGRAYFASRTNDSSVKAYSTLYKVTPVSTEENPCDTSIKYVALCLDPGRRGPTESGTAPSARYVKVDDVKPNSEFGKLMVYLVQNIPLKDFEEIASPNRVAAHFSARLVAAQVQWTAGYDATDDDSIHKQQYLIYQDLVSKIDTSESVAEVKADLETVLNFSLSSVPSGYLVSGVGDLAAEILGSYSKNTDGTEGDASTFTREITETKAEAYGSNGYTITYKGTIAFPSGAFGIAGQDGLIPGKCENYGVKCEVKKWSKNEGASASANRDVFDFEILITAEDAMNVKIPRGEAQEKEVSFEIKYTGAGAVNSIMLTQAQGDQVGVLQRMLVIALTTPTAFIYFPIIPNVCLEIDALNPDNCKSADNCSPDKFNKELFLEAQCCEEVTDEASYPYIVNSLCGGQCTTSTMVEICEYSSETVGKADLYEVIEGTRYEGSAGEGSSGVQYSYDIGACVANVSTDYDTTYGGGLSSNTNFQISDDVGETRNLPEYEDNMYCQVTCREDWQISMDAFGNYVGKNAVAAGTYFQIVNNDVFMSGSRFCYTSYLDYDQYMHDLTTASKNMIDAYNKYSENTHIWTNINNTEQADQSCVANTYYTGHTCTGSTANDDLSCSPTGPVSDQVRTCTLSVQSDETDNDKNNQTYNYYSATDAKKVGDKVVELDIKKERKTYTKSETSSCSSSTTDMPDGGSYISSYSGECTNSEATQYTTLKERLKTNASAAANSARSNMNTYKKEIEDRAEDFFDCQYFQFYNVSDAKHGYTSMPVSSDKYLDFNKQYVKVETAFDPTASYEYDEEGFMAILKANNENYLEVFDIRNEEILPGYSGIAEDGRVQLKDRNTGDSIVTPSGDNAYLSRNYTELYFYNPDEKWEKEEGSVTNYNTYGETDTASSRKRTSRGAVGDDEWGIGERVIIFCDGDVERDGDEQDWGEEVYEVSSDSITEYKAEEGGCYEYKIQYTSTHYIMSSIENSSYYKNQGFWYQSYGVDMKEHGANKQAALSNASNRGTNYFSGANSGNVLDRWGLYGEYNVFPISMTTPRGLYQYEYSFFNVGVYPFDDTDEPELGRVMGYNESIIKMNTRVCFYEVFEEVCLCCGDEINVSYDDEDYVIDEFLNSYSGPFDYEQSLLDTVTSKEGTIAIATSSISLANPYPNSNGTSGSSGSIAGNLGTQTPFLYNGNNELTTDKGANLLNEIIAKGETIYDHDESNNNLPEYAFYLTPSTLTAIREYNDANGYEVNYNNLKIYGKYTIAETDGGWGEGLSDAELDEHITFVHFGSMFLEDFMKPFTYADSITSYSNVCTIDDNAGNFDGKTLNSMVRRNNCRWIDYIETGNGEKYRLVFK